MPDDLYSEITGQWTSADPQQQHHPLRREARASMSRKVEPVQLVRDSIREPGQRSISSKSQRSSNRAAGSEIIDTSFTGHGLNVIWSFESKFMEEIFAKDIFVR